MTTLIIDGKTYTAETEGRNLLEVCLSLGLNVPYFCWHPVFRSIGACRQCAVKVFKDERDTRGRIEMSCMIGVTQGMRISIDDPEVVAFRAKIIEWLMVNHPHDCPVCDEGGECHLQDMTVMTGHTYRRHRFKKVTFRDQALGPFVNQEMNRCIECYRCVRFYRDYAGGRDFDVHGWHDHVFFGRHEEGALQSEFSGNLVEVCPTGVFTDKGLKRHYARKWDLQTAPSVCVHCGLGCNTIPGERYGMLRRISPRFNGKVNGYFLCDRGRYGYEFVNSDARIREPLVRQADGRRGAVGSGAAAGLVAGFMKTGKTIGIGSPRASLESNFALRQLVGPDRFFLGLPAPQLRLIRAMLDILRDGPARTPSLGEVEACDAVFILGEDVTNTAPMLDLAVRQAVLRQPREYAGTLGVLPWLDAVFRTAIQDRRGPLFVATPVATKLDDQGVAYRGAPADLARLGSAVAHEIDAASPAVEGLADTDHELARRIASALKSARKPLVISGPACGSGEVIEAAANVAWALARTGRDAALSFALPECNSMGLAMLEGGDMDAALAAVRGGKADTVIVLEGDPYRFLGDEAAEALFSGARHVVAIDHLTNPTTLRAEVVLPAATFAEATGTFVNNEGRAQRSFQVFVPEGPAIASWRWISRVAGERWTGLDELLDELARTLPQFAGVPSVAPAAGFRIGGQKVPRQPSRYTGRAAMTAHLDVHEPQPPEDPDTPLAFSMEGSTGEPPPALLPRYWTPGWNSVQALNKFQTEVGGGLHGGDPGLRLIEPRRDSQRPYFAQATAAFFTRPGEWRIVPAWHIFGSEELSVFSPGVADSAPKPYVALNPGDAARHGLAEGQGAALTWADKAIVLTVRLAPSLPRGVAAVGVGLPGMPAIALPEWGRVTAVSPTTNQEPGIGGSVS